MGEGRMFQVEGEHEQRSHGVKSVASPRSGGEASAAGRQGSRGASWRQRGRCGLDHSGHTEHFGPLLRATESQRRRRSPIGKTQSSTKDKQVAGMVQQWVSPEARQQAS